MKTPHSIVLLRGESVEEFNPTTGEYITKEQESETVPCLVNKISQAKTFELYGTKDDTVIIARFAQEQQPFTKAIFKGDTYKPYDAIDAPIKGAVRLKKVIE